MIKKLLLISKYTPPWIGVPLIKNMETFFGKNISFIPYKSNSLNILYHIFYFIIIQFKILIKSFNHNKIVIYNDMSLVIITFPLLKIISFFKKIKIYYIFESKWFSKYGDILSPIFCLILNNKIYKKIFIFDSLLSSYLISKKINSSKFVKISTGVDSKLFYPKNKKFNFDFLYAGTLHKRRKLDIILNAINLIKNKYKKFNLIILGDGKELENLKRLVRKFYLSKNVNFIGKVNQERVPDYIRKSDICLAPYPKDVFNIQLPYKILEYMACQKPVITTDTLATRKYFKNNVNALITKFNKKDLSEAISTLIENKKLRERISNEGFKVSKKFRWNKVMKIIQMELNRND